MDFLDELLREHLRTLEGSFWHCLDGLGCTGEFVQLLKSWLDLPDWSTKAGDDLIEEVKGLAGGRVGREFKGKFPSTSLLKKLAALPPEERKNLVHLLVALECAKPSHSALWKLAC